MNDSSFAPEIHGASGGAAYIGEVSAGYLPDESDKKMSGNRPKVSIAVPVFNGDNYVAEALESVLAQIYRNFEVIISDNGSTDRTEEICRGYAERDPRVHYYRSDVNRGVYWNFRRALEPAQGDYFMWLAHDDKLAPEFLGQCVTALDRNPNAVLSYPKAIDIDERGKYLVYKEQNLNAGTARAHERFRELIRMDHNCEAIFGLMRMEVLKKIRVFGGFADADRVMLAELALYGCFSQVPEFLFLHREHPLRTTNVYPLSRFRRTAILLPQKRVKIVFPHFRQFREYLLCIRRSPLHWADRLRCYREMLRWLRCYWKRMLGDVTEVLVYILRGVLGTALGWRRSDATGGGGA
jgi:glycosyltransferase involved in cell wall biosynthesis